MNRDQKIQERKIKIQEKKLKKQGRKKEFKLMMKILKLSIFLGSKKAESTLEFINSKLDEILTRPIEDRLIDLEYLITIIENIIKQKL